MTWLLKFVLWLLSTLVGTIILCGMDCFSTKFPFIHTFPNLPLHKRQRIMQSWSLSFFRHLRMFFKTIKLLTLLVFFTQVIFLIPFACIKYYYYMYKAFNVYMLHLLLFLFLIVNLQLILVSNKYVSHSFYCIWFYDQ